VRLAELTAALSTATDLAMGQPLEWAMTSCVLAVRIGEAMALPDSTLREIYYQALLRYIGCNAETYQMAALLGDELALRSEIATYDLGNSGQVLGLILRHIRSANAGKPALDQMRTVASGLIGARDFMRTTFAGHCEVAQRLATRLGFGEATLVCLGQLYERWDGKGLPNGLKAEAVALPVRVVTLAQDAATFLRIGGVEAVVATVRERRGTAYDPAIADRFLAGAADLLAGLDEAPPWDSVLAVEPGRPVALDDQALDDALEAIADFADIKSPYTVGHSPAVASLAMSGARYCGLPDDDVDLLRRAALVHDVGRVGVSAGVWGKAGALTDREWEQVRLHPYFTERILTRSPLLARIGQLGASHHERLDGSGYHRGLPAALLSPAARILAAADVYAALLEPRPHRAALPADQAAETLRREVRAGKLDGEAVDGVLSAAGHRVRGTRRMMVGGLSSREIDVLRAIARGRSTREIADDLVISPKTADNHIQHIYTKIGVSTRAAATLFAMEQGLIGPGT
jgi:HD-GYP domain-containing protein (c-di-GMP phosphodiesterase class II)